MAGPRNGERPEALDEFMTALRALREQAGTPSFRQMAAKSGAVSHSTLHLTVTGFRLQPWETVREFVRACDGDEAEWHAHWGRVARALQGDAEDPAESADAKTSTDQEVPEDPAESTDAKTSTDQGVAENPAESEHPEDSGRTDHVPEPLNVSTPASSHESHLVLSTDVRNVEVPASRRAWSRRSASLVAAVAVAVFATLTVINVYTLADSTEDAESTSAETQSDSSIVSARAVYEGDASEFIDDVTYTDGTTVAPGTRFTKVWELRNIGSVEWRDRYLRRIELPIESDDCRTPHRVRIPMTSPGQKVRISVPVEAPSKAPVRCKVHWKMIDSAERIVLPGYRPIFFDVRVREMP